MQNHQSDEKPALSGPQLMGEMEREQGAGGQALRDGKKREAGIAPRFLSWTVDLSGDTAC